MLEITTITIVISVVALLFSLVSPLFCAFFRTPKHEGKAFTDGSDTAEDNEEENAGTHTPKGDNPISIVIVAHDNAPELERSLPLFLSQKYDSDYEVIIVADESDSETDDVIKKFVSHRNLYATFMPLSSRYISRKKLAITLGIKAAKYPWVIVTDAWCRPDDDQWLRSFAENCTHGRDIVLGHTVYADDAPVRYHYEHAVHAAYNLRSAFTGRGITTNSPLVAIRKECFMDGDGFLGNLKFMRGEYAFLVNKYSEEGNTGVALAPSSFLKEDTPFKKRWCNNHLFAINAQGSLDGFIRLKALYLLDNTMMFLCHLTVIAGIIYGAVCQDWIALGASILAFIVEYMLRVFLSRKALLTFHAPISFILVPLLDFTQPLCDLRWRIKYWFADKYDFITHKI